MSEHVNLFLFNHFYTKHQGEQNIFCRLIITRGLRIESGINKRPRTAASKEGHDAVKEPLTECLRLLTKSRERYGRLKESRVPEVVVYMERILIWRLLMLIFGLYRIPRSGCQSLDNAELREY